MKNMIIGYSSGSLHILLKLFLFTEYTIKWLRQYMLKNYMTISK